MCRLALGALGALVALGACRIGFEPVDRLNDGSITSDGTSDGGSGSLVISQVYESGGKSGAAFARDYVVLKNTGSQAVDPTGWSFQHYKTTLGWKVLPLEPIALPPGGTYLISLYYDGGASSGAEVPFPDQIAPAISDWNLSTSTPESIAIVDDTTALTTCTSSSIVDLMGYGSSPPCSEGGTVAPTTTITFAAQRKNGGTQDTNDNAADFVLVAPTP